MTNAQDNTARAAVEFDGTVNGKEMHFYYVAGSCAARSMHGFDGKADKPETRPTPTEVITGIVKSGVSGCLMLIADVYSNGAAAKEFEKFIKANPELGSVAVNYTPSYNPYTGRQHIGLVYQYDIGKLADWVAKQNGKTEWKKPKGWWSNTDAIHMDGAFYQYGGRPKPASGVQIRGTLTPAEL
jgi:hypothetical protein